RELRLEVDGEGGAGARRDRDGAVELVGQIADELEAERPDLRGAAAGAEAPEGDGEAARRHREGAAIERGAVGVAGAAASAAVDAEDPNGRAVARANRGHAGDSTSGGSPRVGRDGDLTCRGARSHRHARWFLVIGGSPLTNGVFDLSL